MARIVKVSEIAEAVRNLCAQVNFELPGDVKRKIEELSLKEESLLGKEIFSQLLENATIASSERIPLCQDTGLVVVFLELGQEVQLKGDSLYEAINRGVSEAYTENYLRASMVADPLMRKNTQDNTPAVIHTEIVPGDRLRIWVVPKGGGSENMSRLRMLKPAAGWEGIKHFVLETVEKAGANPCPPVIVGVGIGGNFEKCAFLAKKALLRPLNQSHRDDGYARREDELLCAINGLGIGPQGLGGRITALAVHIEAYPCHIASLPVAVNIQCHAARHMEIEL